MRDVDHVPLNSGSAIVRPAISIVTSQEQRIERDSRIEVRNLRERGSILQPVKISSATGKRNPNTRTISREHHPNRQKDNDNDSNQQ
jgi:hypothetical protein